MTTTTPNYGFVTPSATETPYSPTVDTMATAIDAAIFAASGVDSLNALGGVLLVVGAGEVGVVSAGNTLTISGTPHPEELDTVSDAIIGGVGITVTSGTDTTTIDGHLRYTSAENDAIIGAGEVVVTSGIDIITISGTPHTRGAAISGEWRFSTSTATVPTKGTFRMNNVTYSGTTELYFADETDNGVDATNFLTVLGDGDRIYFQNETDGSQFGVFDIIAATTDEGDWFRLPVSLVQNGDIITNNRKSIITLLFGGTPIPSENALVGGIGITVTSGSNETVIDGHLRYTSAENEAIIAGSNVTVVSGAGTITISSTGGAGANPDGVELIVFNRITNW